MLTKICRPFCALKSLHFLLWHGGLLVLIWFLFVLFCLFVFNVALKYIESWYLNSTLNMNLPGCLRYVHTIVEVGPYKMLYELFKVHHRTTERVLLYISKWHVYVEHKAHSDIGTDLFYIDTYYLKMETVPKVKEDLWWNKGYRGDTSFLCFSAFRRTMISCFRQTRGLLIYWCLFLPRKSLTHLQGRNSSFISLKTCLCTCTEA